jgi:hypothetical protein
MTSQPTIFQTQYFFNDGRGPQIAKWIKYDDLYFPPSSVSKIIRSPSDDITGIQFMNWVVFYGNQVIQIVPEEVHSYWHTESYYEACKAGSTDKKTGAWLIENSEWIKTFHPRHLSNAKHFILEFYDDIIEVICDELIFGEGKFDLQKLIEQDSRFANAYIVNADNENYLGNIDEALLYYQKYLQYGNDPKQIEITNRKINDLLKAKS